MAQSFKAAFAAGRAAFLKGGSKNFTWNGKSYSTDLASDTKKKPAAETAPPRRPAAPPVKAAKPAVTTPTTSPRPRTAVSGVVNAKPKVDTVARDMLNKNIVKATGDKLATERTVATPVRQAAGTPFAASRTNPKVTPLGKSNGIGGRLAEAVKSLGSALKGKPAAKPKAAFKTPNRADVMKKKK